MTEIRDMEIQAAKLTPVQWKVGGRIWKLRTDFGKEAQEFIRQELDREIQRLREIHKDVSMEEIYFLVAANLAGRLYEKQQEVTSLWLQVEEFLKEMDEQHEE